MKRLVIYLALLGGLVMGCAPRFESVKSESSSARDSSVCELNEQQYEKLSKEINELENTSAEVFKRFLEKILERQSEIPAWQNDAALIERRLSYIERKISDIEQSRNTASTREVTHKEDEKRLVYTENMPEKSSAVASPSVDAVFKALLEESVVPVQVGKPTTISFAHSIESGLYRRSHRYTLKREERKVTITVASKLNDSGEPLFVQLKDSSFIVVRLVNASKRNPPESEIFIGEPEGCGGVWYDDDW